MINHSWLGNILFVAKVKLGKTKLTQETLEKINKTNGYKLTKRKQTFSDKIFIWGTKIINKSVHNASNTDE
jgi:hypothetical protein